MRRAWRGMAAFALVVAAVSMLMSAWLFKLNADRVDEINAERSANVQRNCEDVNRRHDRTLAALDRLIADRLRHASPADRARLEASRDSTALLIEALVPQRDCSVLAERQVTTP